MAANIDVPNALKTRTPTQTTQPDPRTAETEPLVNFNSLQFRFALLHKGGTGLLKNGDARHASGKAIARVMSKPLGWP